MDDIALSEGKEDENSYNKFRTELTNLTCWSLWVILNARVRNIKIHNNTCSINWERLNFFLCTSNNMKIINSVFSTE
jgi:hypothetical protein